MTIDTLAIAEKTLLVIEEYILQKDINEHIEINMDSNEILNLDTKAGLYVININSAVKQIWLSSPVSGPYHFDYTNNNWTNKKNQTTLGKILDAELKQYIANIELDTKINTLCINY